MTRATAEQYLRDSRRAQNQAEMRGLTAWAEAYRKRAQSLVRLIARLPDEAVTAEARP